MQTQLMEGPNALTVQNITRGHYKLLERMGSKFAIAPLAAETPEQWSARVVAALSFDERSEETSAFFWLVTRRVEELKPGSVARQAIDDGSWRDLVEAFEFELDIATMNRLSEEIEKRFGYGSAAPTRS